MHQERQQGLSDQNREQQGLSSAARLAAEPRASEDKRLSDGDTSELEREWEQEVANESVANESVVNAIREGNWTFEPAAVEEDAFDDTEAMPGSREKVDIMAERVRQGLPIWHSEDRRYFGNGD